MKIQVLLISLTLLLTSCFKTAEEINRERLIDQQLSQSSKIIADLTNQMTELKGGLASTSGQLEEIDHKRKQLSEQQQLSYSQTIAQLSEQVKILTSDNKKTQEQITKLSSELKAQKKFIQKVTGTLTKMSGSSSSSNKSLLKQAHRAFEKNQQKNAKSLYQQVLQEGKISNAQKNHVYFNLGLLDYWNKKYDDALIYFSKIYTKYPKSSFASRSLLYIARSFKKNNKADEATATYQELVKNYPKSKHAKIAKKEM